MGKEHYLLLCIEVD